MYIETKIGKVKPALNIVRTYVRKNVGVLISECFVSLAQKYIRTHIICRHLKRHVKLT